MVTGYLGHASADITERTYLHRERSDLGRERSDLGGGLLAYTRAAAS